MQEFFITLQNRLAPAEEIFFSWLIRVFLAAVLIGSAWIDDAPPLELAAWVIALYVLVRILSQFGAFVSVAPFNNLALKTIFSLGCIGLLGLSFLTIVTFIDRVAVSVAG